MNADWRPAAFAQTLDKGQRARPRSESPRDGPSSRAGARSSPSVVINRLTKMAKMTGHAKRNAEKNQPGISRNKPKHLDPSVRQGRAGRRSGKNNADQSPAMAHRVGDHLLSRRYNRFVSRKGAKAPRESPWPLAGHRSRARAAQGWRTGSPAGGPCHPNGYLIRGARGSQERNPNFWPAGSWGRSLGISGDRIHDHAEARRSQRSRGHGQDLINRWTRRGSATGRLNAEIVSRKGAKAQRQTGGVFNRWTRWGQDREGLSVASEDRRSEATADYGNVPRERQSDEATKGGAEGTASSSHAETRRSRRAGGNGQEF